MKNSIIIILIFSLIGLGFLLFKQNKAMKNYKENLPYFLEGEKIPNIGMVPLNLEYAYKGPIDTKFEVIFFFESPCYSCNKSKFFWNKIHGILKDQIQFTAIVFDNNKDTISFTKKLPFPVYTPRVKEEKKKLRIILSKAQTIILYKGKVRKVYFGDLTPESTIEIIENLKKYS